MRRVVALLALALVVVPIPALADDLEDYLENASGADFRGVGVLVCNWGADTAGGTYEVIRHEGMSMTHGPGGDLMISGSVAAIGSDGEWYAVEFADRAEWALSSRYRLGAPQDTTRLGRPARRYTVFEDDRPRVRLVVDEATGVPMLTEVLDGSGRVFRTAALVEFSVGSDPMEMASATMPSKSVRSVAPSSQLPESVAGYRLVDTYAVPGGALQAFYSDGLFSFSVFQSSRGATPDAFDNGTRWSVDGHSYSRVLTATQVWVHWNAPNHSFVLVGDLPPDHVEAVLAELPDPGNRGLLVRWWRRLFG